MEHLNPHPDFELVWVKNDDAIHDIATDVYMPCALGGTITPDFIKTLRAELYVVEQIINYAQLMMEIYYIKRVYYMFPIISLMPVV